MKHLTTTQQHWQSIIDDWKQTNLSQTAYCQQRNINIQQFYSWKSKLKAIKNPTPTAPAASFLPVVRDQPSESDASLRIHCNNAVIELTHTTDPTLFKKAIHWLSEAS